MAADLLRLLAALTVASSAAILVVLALRLPLRKSFGPRLAYGAWLLAPAATLAIFLPDLRSDFAPVVWDLEETGAAAIAAAPRAVDWPALLLALWLIGAVASVAAVALIQRRAILRLRLSASAAKGDPLRALACVTAPAVIGLIKPRIVLPTDFEARYSESERAVILAHEEAHIRAGDVRTNAVLVLSACLFWFNPLVHIAVRLARIDQELACDAAVIARFPKARRTYAEALLKSQVSSASLPLGCYWPERSHQRLKERMTMLSQKTPGRRRVIAGVLALSVLGLGTGYAAWAFAPQPPALTNSRPAPAFVPVPTDVAMPVPVAAPPGHKQAMLAALGLPPTAKLQIGCNGFGAAACTYVTDDGVRRSMTEAGWSVMRQLNPALAADEDAFEQSEGFVPVPQTVGSLENPAAAPPGLMKAMGPILGVSPQAKITVQCNRGDYSDCLYSADGSPFAPLPEDAIALMRKFSPVIAEAEAAGDGVDISVPIPR